jgi:hypothetical protein
VEIAMRFGIIPAAALLVVLGCGKNEELQLHSVTGEVLYDGKPAAGVQLFFMPENGVNPPGIPANPHATTGPDGRFAVSSLIEGDGAPAGTYRVVLLWPEEKTSDDDEETPDRLFGWHDARHTKWVVSVKEGANALPQFKLAKVTGPPPVSEGIPGRN